MRKPAVAIVGLGRVGAINPDVTDGHGNLVHRNHLHAALAAGFRLIALVDPDPQARTAALSAWRDRAGRDSADCPPHLCADVRDLAVGVADVVTIASPPGLHMRHFEAAIALKPKALLIEKPLAADLPQAQSMVRKAESLADEIGIFVNFHRRADLGMLAWRSHWAGRDPRLVVMRYGDGLMNYASHLVDHALDWFGSPERVRALPPYGLAAGNPHSGDESPSFLLEYADGLIVHVLGFRDIDYDMFEMDVYFADGMVSARNNAVEKYEYHRRADLYYPGYPGLVVDDEGRAASPIGGFTETYRILASRMAGDDRREGAGIATLCPMTTALSGVQILQAVLRSRCEQGRPVHAAEFELAALDAS